ncbi:MAG: NAD-dependent epimerase/dehydratase family protein [Candidatus Aminicenantes bacterium]|nr:NAD-dependent epimerase/dehydratase family protein [Candidatus Aminicenantes bacterium]
MKVAITGASGHIGINLTRLLLQQGFSVRTLVHRNRRTLEGLETEMVAGDILDIKSLYPFSENVDVVFHLAAVVTIQGGKVKKVFEHNVAGTKNVLKAAQETGVKRFIHFSSIHALIQQPFHSVLDENRSLALEDKTAYSRSKAASEVCVFEAIKKGMDAVILNPTAMLGPFDYAPSLLGRAIIQMALGKLRILVPGGYDWVDVRDVASAAAASIEKGKTGERYLLSGHWMDLKTLAELVMNLSNCRVKRWICPFWLAFMGLPFVHLYCRAKAKEPLYTRDSLGALRNSHHDISNAKASRDLGYRPRPMKETLKDTLDWFEQNYFFSVSSM